MQLGGSQPEYDVIAPLIVAAVLMYVVPWAVAKHHMWTERHRSAAVAHLIHEWFGEEHDSEMLP